MLRDDPGWRALTLGLAFGHAALAVVWFGPWHGTTAPGRLSAVQTVNAHFPWGALFTVVGLALLVCGARARGGAIAHGAGFVLLGTFSLLSLLGALPLEGQPVGSLVGCLLGAMLALVHAVAQRHYSREERR